ncbi:calcium-dependent lipid-binding (CaLB domain) family protein [Actinidia rufa]|uniref:Calcium-dependent lipid-binding (CaLB domain) family protein n=1 Tax=Actinidia rufa TaxID=165716 RepID=A0A7J0FHU6_9ERIC|nr:calcium-dependent lipid-binding (CaLB domain) family protein [Actinidia rufa]
MGTIFEVSILHHICVVLVVLWLLSSFNCCHPVAYFTSLIYLHLVHERYVMRLRRKLRFEERRQSNQRRVLSDSESVRWLNYAIEKIWPVCMEQIVSQKILLPIIPWFLQKFKPWTVKEAVVQQLYMGRSPPMFTEMRVLQQSTGDDHLVLELGMNFRTADDMGAVLAAKLTKRLGFGMWARLHLTGMHVEGKVLVGVKFLRHWPFLGRVRLCFVEPPYFQMNVKPIFTHGVDVTELPGIAGWLDKLLATAFEQTLVEPNMLVVDMEKFVSPQEENWFSVDEKEPIAYALVEIIEAADMKPSDLNGLADPFVKGQLGCYKFKTKIEKKTLAPKWYEEFKIPIWTWDSPNVLAIEVVDKDHFVDDALGDGQRHDLWLPLENIKMGRLHLAVTVVEGNMKVREQSCDNETLNDDSERIPILYETTPNGSLSSGMSKPPKVADKFEPIDIEGQEETGIWVHQPGSEISQKWETRKGRSRLNDTQINIGSFKSSASGSHNNDTSSSDESQEDNKGHSPNKVMRGLQKFGSIFRRSPRQEEDTSSKIEEPFLPPQVKLKAVHAKERNVKLIVDDRVSAPSPEPSPVKDSKAERAESLEGSDKATGFFKNAGKSIQQTFSRKGSKNFRGDSGLVVTGRDISAGSGSSEEESLPSSVRTLGVAGIEVVSKPLSGYGGDSFKSQGNNGQNSPSDRAMNTEDPVNKVQENDDLLVESSNFKNSKENLVEDKK